MHMIACGIRCHQNWRIGPSLGADYYDSWEFEIVKVFVYFLNNISEYCRIYPQLVEFVLAGTIVVH